MTFSGDKLLGGPQAGVIAGRADLVDRCRLHPLARALRPGGLVLEVLQEVALAYLSRDAGQTVPLWKMATRPVDELRARAEAVAAGRVRRRGGRVRVGHGWRHAAGRGDPFLRRRRRSATAAAALRTWSPPVIARVHDGRTVCDLRTVLPDQDAHWLGPGCLGGMRVIATAGHVDHGKSTLVWGLTGTDPDRLGGGEEPRADDRPRLRLRPPFRPARRSASSTCPATAVWSRTCSPA